MNELTKYDTIKRDLAQIIKVDELKGIIDKAIAVRQYARRAKDKKLEQDALTYRLQCERRVGQLMKQMEKATGTRGQLIGRGIIGPVSNTAPINQPPTLVAQGIDENLAKRARVLERMSESEFKNHTEKARNNLTISARLDKNPASLIEPDELPRISLVRSALSLIERHIYQYSPEDVSLLKVACLKTIETINTHQSERRIVCLK
jgi:hypothetical protein